MARKLALLIGVSSYGEELDDLSAPSNDVRAMQRVLANPDLGGFEVDIALDPDLVEMREKIESLFERSSKEDLILLYFSGHGIADDNNHLYLTTRNTSKKRYRSRSVPARFIQDLSDGAYAKRQVIILDCCYSGAFSEGWQYKGEVKLDLEQELGKEGRVVLTSSSATQVSYQQDASELSLYTQYIVEGIEQGAADTDQNGEVTVQELHGYAKQKVQEQKPKLKPDIIVAGAEGYDILLSRVKVDVESRFQQLVEKYIDHQQGKIQDGISQEILDTRAQGWGIHPKTAAKIIKRVLEPTRRRLENVERYRQKYTEEVQKQYPLDNQNLAKLREWQQVVLGLEGEDIADIQTEINASFGRKQGIKNDQTNLEPPRVNRKELSECDTSRLLFIKNVRDPNGGWAYTLDRISDMGGSVESRVFELYWTSASRGSKSAAKGDLMLLNQQAKITHVVEMLDNDVRERPEGYFRWVRAVWMPSEKDWHQLPHQRDVIGFEPPTIGGGTAYSLANLGKFQEAWDRLEIFQQHVFQVLTGAKPPICEEIDESLSSERFGANYYAKLQDLLAAKDWKAAEKETSCLMFEVMNCKRGGLLSLEYMREFPCLDLRNIDRLWVKFSNGQFGFSVQKKIWENCGSPTSYNSDWEKFGVTVGWRTKGFLGMFGDKYWKESSELTYDMTAPQGHLPIVTLGGRYWGTDREFDWERLGWALGVGCGRGNASPWLHAAVSLFGRVISCM